MKKLTEEFSFGKIDHMPVGFDKELKHRRKTDSGRAGLVEEFSLQNSSAKRKNDTDTCIKLQPKVTGDCDNNVTPISTISSEDDAREIPCVN